MLYPARNATSDGGIVIVVPEKPTLKSGAHDYSSSSRRLTYAPQAQYTLGQEFLQRIDVMIKPARREAVVVTFRETSVIENENGLGLL